MSKIENYHRYPGEFKPVNTHQYSDMGVVKWCTICKVHKPQTGGKLRSMFGGKHWVCSQHAQPK